MSGKRVLVLYGALLFCFAAVVCRLYWLCSDTAYGARAAAQSVVTLHLPARRGNFYDHRGQLLTGQTTRWMALCVPGEGSYARLFAYTDAAGQAALYQKRNAASPFLLEVDRDVSALGVSCWPVERRNSAAPLAVQLLGYLDGEGHGAAGLEAAFDELLTGSGAGDTLICTVNAQGKLRAEPVLTPADSGAVGVQLTLSREIQQTAEAVANETMQSGCILVLDTANAKVRACVSRPGYDPENISASLNAPDSPLLERAFQCYAVGSVFKPVVAAAALEAGESGFVYTCPGYFIRLGQALGADAVRAMAEKLGFGQAIPLTDALHTAAGVLPERKALASSGAYANFCFGQGELLASPLQVAAMMNTIACGGICRTPLLLETTLDETTGAPLTALSHVRSRRVLTKRTAAALQALLAGVVAGGTGHEAALPGQTAAGKTGTAQTGQFSGGTELKNYWFAGFVPAEQPRYTIVVLQDTQAEPAFSSAAIFARVAAGLEILAP